jgi:hypothetical protein
MFSEANPARLGEAARTLERFVDGEWSNNTKVDQN